MDMWINGYNKISIFLNMVLKKIRCVYYINVWKCYVIFFGGVLDLMNVR